MNTSKALFLIEILIFVLLILGHLFDIEIERLTWTESIGITSIPDGPTAYFIRIDIVNIFLLITGITILGILIKRTINQKDMIKNKILKLVYLLIGPLLYLLAISLN